MVVNNGVGRTVTKNTEAKDNIQQLKDRAGMLDEEIMGLSSKKEQYMKDNRQLETTISLLTGQIEDIKKELVQSNITKERLAAENSELNLSIVSVQKEISDLSTVNSSLLEDTKDKNNEITRLRSENEGLTNAIQQLNQSHPAALQALQNNAVTIGAINGILKGIVATLNRHGKSGREKATSINTALGSLSTEDKLALINYDPQNNNNQRIDALLSALSQQRALVFKTKESTSFKTYKDTIETLKNNDENRPPKTQNPKPKTQNPKPNNRA